MSIEYYIAAYAFDQGSNHTPNYNFSGTSYWTASGNQTSAWYTTAQFFSSSQCLGFNVEYESISTVNQLNDNFDGVTGNPPNPSKWTRSAATVTIDANALKISRVASVSYVENVSLFYFTGNFDIQIDYKNVDVYAASGATFAFSVTNSDDSRMYRMEVVSPLTYRWTKFEGSYTYNNIGAAAAYGKIAIVRSGTVIDLKYKNLDASSWSTGYTFTGVSTDNMYVTLYIYQGVSLNSAESVKFDNFQINNAGGFTMNGNINQIYHSAAADYLYPGSAYELGGMMLLSRGGGGYRFDLLTSDLSSTILTYSFDLWTQHNAWNKISKPFSVSALVTNPVLRISQVGTISFVTAYLDDFGIADYKEWNSLGVLRIYPEWEMKKETVQNRADHRTKGGKLYSYQWGDYDRIDVPLEYVQNSKAAIINSWWAVDALIHFKVFSGGAWSTYSCHLMNDTAPFDERVKPYDQYRAGRLELETF